MSRTIVFFGNERLATGVTTSAPALRGLLEAGYNVAAVVVAQNQPGASRQPRELEVATIAKKHNIAALTSHDGLASLKADAAVLAAYGKKLPQGTIDLFPRGIINIHPSLLPRYRGSTPIENAILDGAKQTGVSLMQLVAGMDTGPVYAQQPVSLSGQESKQELTDQLDSLGTELLIKNLPAILDGSLQPKPQNETEATYSKQIEKADGELDFAKTAGQLEREVRAYAGWPRSRTKIGNVDVIVTKTHVENGSGTPGKLWQNNQQLGIYTSENILAIDSLIPAGKPEMPAQAFIAGYKDSLIT